MAKYAKSEIVKTELRPANVLTKEAILAAVKSNKMTMAEALDVIAAQTEANKRPIQIGQSKKGAICIYVGRMPVSQYPEQILRLDAVWAQVVAFAKSHPVTDAHKAHQAACKEAGETDDSEDDAALVAALAAMPSK